MFIIDNMDLFEAIESRVNVKVYDRRDVPEELISQILAAGTYAPSAGDIQPWEFIVVKDKTTKSELAIASLRQKHVEDAPLVIVVCANLDKVSLKFKERGRTLYAIQDTGAAIENMLLTTHALGLGGAWVHAFEEEAVKRLLKIPDHLRPVGILTIGFPLPYEKYYKTDVIPFENISWSEQYGKELPWTFKNTWKNRFGVEKTIAEHVSEAKEKIIESISEKHKEIPQVERQEVKKEGISSKILNFIKKLSKPKT